ncbi:MAG: hypothetical protein ACYDCQ_06425, partial [Dehalococcoidia bacterium]
MRSRQSFRRPPRAAATLLALALLFGLALLPRGSTLAQQPRPMPAVVATIDRWQIADPAFTPLPGAQAYFGVLGRAGFRIEIPDNWNGELVMYAHGYAGEGPLLRVENPSIRQHLVDLGFAWAASSYQQNGYVPDFGVSDTLALRDYFIGRFGQPTRTYIDGTSMGGHVVASLEQHPGVYDGALAECGALMQAQELDYILAYNLVALYLAGTGLPPMTDPAAESNFFRTRVLPALGSPETPTQRGLAFESIIENLTGGPRPFRHEGFADFYLDPFLISTAVPSTSVAMQVATDDDITFHVAPGLGVSDADLNAGVLRLSANPLLRNAETNPTFALPTGNITAPLLTYHTTGDDYVPILNEINYRRL